MLRKKSFSDRELWAIFTKEIRPSIDELTELPENDRLGYYFDHDHLIYLSLPYSPEILPLLRFPSLQVLSLPGVFITPRFIKHLHHLPALKRLFLIKCQNVALPPEIGQLNNLEMLVLQDSRIAALPRQIGRMHALKVLDVSQSQSDNPYHMSLIYLPPEIGQMQSLSILSLDGCQISSLPATIGSLVHLNHLYLTRTLLLTLPAEIGGLSALRTLDLRDSSIIALPSEIGLLQSLTTFLLAGSRIESLPSTIGSLCNLELLDLTDTPINALPPEIGRLSPGCIKRFPTSIPGPIIELLSTLEGCRRYAEYPTFLIEKVRNNLPLESADRAYPWFARFASVLEPVCHQYNNATAREIIALIQYDQPTIDVILNKLDFAEDRSHNLRKRRILHSR